MNTIQTGNNEFWFVIFGLIPLVIFIRLFFIGTIAWVGTAVAYPFYLTRHLWIFLGYVLANVWFLSAKIFGVGAIVVAICYYFGYKDPATWTFIGLMYVFFWWPLWVLNTVMSFF